MQSITAIPIIKILTFFINVYFEIFLIQYITSSTPDSVFDFTQNNISDLPLLKTNMPTIHITTLIISAITKFVVLFRKPNLNFLLFVLYPQ